MTFSFETDVNPAPYQRILKGFGLNDEDIRSMDLASEFRNDVCERIVESSNLKSAVGVHKLEKMYGFKSEESVKRFLSDPEIFNELNTKMKKSTIELSPELLEKMQSTFESANKKQMDAAEDSETVTAGDHVLASLFDIFEFIKELSDDDVASLEEKHPGHIKHYARGSLKTFRDDLKTMEPLDFESKYAGCYHGMLENMLGSILDAEKLLSTMKTIQAEKTVQTCQSFKDRLIDTKKAAAPPSADTGIEHSADSESSADNESSEDNDDVHSINYSG